MISRTLQTSK